jgi:hypothetical protein
MDDDNVISFDLTQKVAFAADFAIKILILWRFIPKGGRPC